MSADLLAMLDDTKRKLEAADEIKSQKTRVYLTCVDGISKEVKQRIKKKISDTAYTKMTEEKDNSDAVFVVTPYCQPKLSPVDKWINAVYSKILRYHGRGHYVVLVLVDEVDLPFMSDETYIHLSSFVMGAVDSIVKVESDSSGSVEFDGSFERILRALPLLCTNQ